MHTCIRTYIYTYTHKSTHIHEHFKYRCVSGLWVLCLDIPAFYDMTPCSLVVTDVLGKKKHATSVFRV